jgi:hypothetical protein
MITIFTNCLRHGLTKKKTSVVKHTDIHLNYHKSKSKSKGQFFHPEKLKRTNHKRKSKPLTGLLDVLWSITRTTSCSIATRACIASRRASPRGAMIALGSSNTFLTTTSSAVAVAWVRNRA